MKTLAFFLLSSLTFISTTFANSDRFESAKVKLIAETVDYIFQDVDHDGMVNASSELTVLQSIPLNQSATRKFAQGYFDQEYNGDRSFVENLETLNKAMVAKLKSNPARKADPRRLQALEDLATRLDKMAYSMKITEEAPAPLPDRNTRALPATTQEKLIDDVEELKIKADMHKPFDPSLMFIGLGMAILLITGLGVYVLILKKEVSLLKGIVHKLSSQMNALHDRMFDIESSLMRIPKEFKEDFQEETEDSYVTPSESYTTEDHYSEEETQEEKTEDEIYHEDAESIMQRYQKQAEERETVFVDNDAEQTVSETEKKNTSIFDEF